MKKILLLIISAALLLSGCGGDTPEEACFRFLYNDIPILPGDPASPVIEALGQPNSYTEEASCAFEGLDKTWVYSGFSLTTYPNGGEDYIHTIWFTDDSVTTEEGIFIGAAQQAVDAAYGAEHWNDVNAYVITRSNVRLTIILTDGLVSSVKYEAVF